MVCEFTVPKIVCLANKSSSGAADGKTLTDYFKSDVAARCTHSVLLTDHYLNIIFGQLSETTCY